MTGSRRPAWVESHGALLSWLREVGPQPIRVILDHAGLQGAARVSLQAQISYGTRMGYVRKVGERRPYKWGSGA